MKLFVRSLVIALALTGAVASTQASSTSAKAQVTFSRASAMPIPTCPPGDPTACGILTGN